MFTPLPVLPAVFAFVYLWDSSFRISRSALEPVLSHLTIAAASPQSQESEGVEGFVVGRQTEA